ncbi:MAG TPA: hypothetical protein ENF81_11085 [Thermotogaceae bacterium]|nr:hypothetical protein [Thermotogaceae bacterium]
MSTLAKEKLIRAIKELDDKTVEKLLEEWDDILLQLHLESDEEFLKTVEKARKGEDLISHEELKKDLGI